MPERNAGRSRRKLIGYIALTLAVAVAVTVALYLDLPITICGINWCGQNCFRDARDRTVERIRLR